MKISYNWLCDYLPEQVPVEKLSKILTAIGLEVESVEPYESIKGGLNGVVVGEVLTCDKHPDADKLKLTTVNVGADAPLQIVCGAANVAAGQKVVVALSGTTIYPAKGEPLTLSKRKIRGVESNGMICAEDELGMGDSHDGIMVLDASAVPGTPAAKMFDVYVDHIIEIGLTPNHMDAMSHLGVARDVCAWLSHHNRSDVRPKQPSTNVFKSDSNVMSIPVEVENATACARYSGLSLKGITVKPSPTWMQNRLKAIGLRPINNIVDITNYVLHETGQPLHAFDFQAIEGGKVVVKTLAENTLFVTLDEKERKLSSEDLMICNAKSPMCIGGVFGGLNSGVKDSTTDLFLESAWFAPTGIRKTSMRHGLRTDAATRFEKGVDISNTVTALKRAALLMKEMAGGEIASDIIDVYPAPKEKAEVALKYQFLKKLSGKNYHPDAVKRIFNALGFELVKESIDEIRMAVPHHKPDIAMQADLVEEIMRIDGLDNVEIPKAILMSPQVEADNTSFTYREKLSNALTGLGFYEMFTNSITNSKYYDETMLANAVKMLNNLSADLDVLRPSMLETALETVAYNHNRKNTDLRLFEFGKTYSTSGVGRYGEKNHLALVASGNKQAANWNAKENKTDIYFLKSVVQTIAQLLGVNMVGEAREDGLQLMIGNIIVGQLQQVEAAKLAQFDIKQPVFYADLHWDEWMDAVRSKQVKIKEVPKFPAVQRDLAIVVDKTTAYHQVESLLQKVQLPLLQNTRLFDVFESEKLGADKRSMAINFTFQDEEKTLTDKEIDAMMSKIQQAFEKGLNAVVRQ
jgi:phenylalanyl-tRNA synthetase beta chain